MARENIRFLIPSNEKAWIVCEDSGKYFKCERIIGWSIDDENDVWPLTAEGIDNPSNAVGVLWSDGSVEIFYDTTYKSIDDANEALDKKTISLKY